MDDINMDSIKSNSSQSFPTPYVRTESDGNDLFCQYHGQFPSYDTETMTSMDQLCDGPMFQCAENDEPQHPLPIHLLILSKSPTSPHF